MHERNCPICGSNKKHIIEKICRVNFIGDENIFDNQDIVECELCGGIYHEGMSPEELNDFYSQYYGDNDIQELVGEDVVLHNGTADFVDYHVHPAKNADILDAGCGYGWVVDLLEKKGYQNVYGIDLDAKVTTKLAEKGYKIAYGSVYDEYAPFGKKYDVIVSRMVFEHLYSPIEAVEGMRRWLKEDGILVLEVPDCSLYDRTSIFRGQYQSVNAQHINNFSVVSMMNMMRKWRLVACESSECEGWYPVLRMAFRYDEHLERSIICSTVDKESILKSLYVMAPNAYVEKNIEKIGTRECVIWGCSLFTRGLLTYTELKNKKIAYFVDANEEIQKKTLMGKKILAPIEIKNFDGLIVIPGKTSAESIKRDIERYGYKNEIICLSEKLDEL